MDFGLRDWLLIIGPVFVIGVLLHGYLRMRANRNTLKMALDKSFMSRPGERFEEKEDDLPLLKAELPNGGARVRIIPQQTKLDLDQDVPVLMEPVEMGDQQIVAQRDEPVRVNVGKGQSIQATKADASPAKVEAAERPEHFVVVYVAAVDDPFEGQALLESLIELDMQFGEMSIFHRFDDGGESLFSLVNAVEPGTFDPAHMDQLQTPAVSLFMRTHELDRPLEVYDQMIDVAQTLAATLGGEVKDSSRSLMTPPTTARGRDEIRDYIQRYH
jgi:cell division protein ZipA